MNISLIRDFFSKTPGDNLSHAFLLFGGDREEKFIFAKSFANFLEKGAFENPTSPLSEVLFVEKPEDKDEIGIDLVRQIRNFLFRPPSLSSKRVVIIRETEKLTDYAQNAILKITEEPPKSALMFFIADTEHGIIPTLSSRLQKIYFEGESSESDKKDKNFVWKVPQSPINDEAAEKIFKNLIFSLKKEAVENSAALKKTLKRLVAVKQFNTNKKLQIKALFHSLGKSAPESSPRGKKK